MADDALKHLAAAYRTLLARNGLDLAFDDVAPDEWPELYPDGAFDPRVAQRAIRRLENQRRYPSFTAVGTEPEVNYLHRLAVVGSVGGPYQGEGLPALQKVLDDQMAEVRAWLTADGVVLPFDVFAGVFPSGDFNARARPEPPWGALLLINSGLMDLLFTILKTNIASSFGPGEPPLLTESQVVKVLAEAFNAYLFSDSSVRSWGLPRLPEARVGNLNFVLRRSEQFVLAHEVGHVALGHVSIAKRDRPVPHTPAMELAADTFAVSLLTASLRSAPVSARVPMARYLAGAAMTFLAVASAIEVLQADLGLERRDVGSHPDTKGRAAALAAMLRRHVREPDALRSGEMFSRWLLHFLPDVINQIKRVDDVMERPPYLKRR